MAQPGEMQQLDVYSFLTLVDRTGLGGREFMYGGIVFPFKRGQAEITIPKFVAEWLFLKGKEFVWAVDTSETPTFECPFASCQQALKFTNLYAIKDCPDELKELWGEHCADTSEIVRDPHMIEGTDAPLYRIDRVRAVNVAIPPQEIRDRLGRGDHVATIPR